MKRMLCFFFAFSLMICSLFAFSVEVSAESGVWGENLTWNLAEDGTLTLSGEGEMASEYWSSDYPWYSKRQSVEKIVIGEGITSVANDAFYGCSNLKEIVLPSTLKAVYSYAFCSSNGAYTVTIPPTVEIIEMMAFYGAETIKGYTYSAAHAYADSEEIEFVSLGELPEAVIFQGECGESATFSLTNRNVLTISGTGATAFYEYEEWPWCNYLNRVQKIVVEKGITAVGTTFNGCNHVKEIVIGEGVESIDYMAFYGCWRVESLTLPTTLKTIGDNAFDSIGLTELIIPEGVESIGEYAFLGELKKVTIPSSVTYIGEEAFGSESDLVIYGERGSYAEDWAFENGFVFKAAAGSVSGTIGENISWTLNEEGILTISGTGEIPSWNGDRYSPWYEYRDEINEVVIENGITSLGEYSFWYNTSLSKITIPESVEYIDFYFIYNNSLTITVKGYTYSEAYFYASDRGFRFESMGYAAKKEIANGKCGENTVWTLDNYGTLTVSGNGEIENPYNWQDYKYDIKDVVIENGVTSICSDAFTDCDNLKTITIPVSVTYISEWAFSGIRATVKGYSPSEAESFAKEEGYTFESLGTAPITVVASGKCGEDLNWTFDNYGLLKISGTGEMDFGSGEAGGDVAIGGDASATVRNSAFDVPWYTYCDKIKSVEMSDGMTSIADYAFYNCDVIEEIILPDSIRIIGEYAFAYCDKLSRITVHYNTASIAQNAFTYSTELTICGYEYSSAYDIAIERNIPFESMGEAPVVDVETGKLTDTIQWIFDNHGVLSVYGTGNMPEYNGDAMPWSKYASSIKKVCITGVYKVTSRSFDDLSNVREIVFDNVTEIENYTFTDSRYIKTVTMSPSVKKVSRYSFGYNASEIEYKGYKDTYAQVYAEYFNATFIPLDGLVETRTVYVSSINELIAAIDSNTVIVIEDGVYMLDRSSYLGNKEYTWTYADTIRIENVINLTIKARNPGKVEILAAQRENISYYSYQNAPFYIAGAYNLVIEGIRFGNMEMRANNGYKAENDGIALYGGYNEDALNGFFGSYITSSTSDSTSDGYVVPVSNKVKFSDCDIFNCTYAVAFHGKNLTIENCTIRDNVKGAINVTSGDLTVSNSTFSHNGNSEKYRGTYLFDISTDGDVRVGGSTFINNGNETYASKNMTENENRFSNNKWDGETVKAYGVTHNGITWVVTDVNGDATLKLGYDVNAENFTIASESGVVYPYTNTSLPWNDFGIKNVLVNDGVTYSFKPNDACGERILWIYDESTKTLTLSGKGNMSNMGYVEELYNYDIENIVIDDEITGVYNIFSGTGFADNKENWENGVLYIGDVLVRVDNTTAGEVVVKYGTRLIADEAFHNCNLVTSVVIPETVTSLGVTEKLNVGEFRTDGTFSYCSSLEKLTIPASVTEFDHAFVYYCDNLKDIYYSGTKSMWENIVVGMKNEQLEYCTIHTSSGTIEPEPYSYIIDEDGVTITSIYPFATEIVIPETIENLPVVELSQDLFAGHKTLKSVVIEADVEEVPYFTAAKNLESVKFGDGVKYIFAHTFAGCEKLRSIIIAGDLEELSADALTDTAYYKNENNWHGDVLYVDGYATALKNDASGTITIKNGARGVSYNMFNNNSLVTEIIIPDGVKVQSYGETFYNMSALTHIRLSDVYVKSDYGFGVWDCEKLNKITISDNHESLCDVDGVVFTKDMKTLVYMPMGKTGSHEILQGVETIAAGAFSDTHLSTVTIPESVKTISDGAFPYSYYLKDVYYNITASEWEDMDSIYVGYGNNAFNNANLHLKDFEFIKEVLDFTRNETGYTVTGCRSYATEVTIPAMYKGLPVNSVESDAFYDAMNLCEIKVEQSSEFFTTINGVLFKKDGKTLVKYPAGKKEKSYKLPAGVTEISSLAFGRSEHLKNIDLGEELEVIGTWAFENSGIVEVRLPKTLSTIPTGAFATMSLEKIYFGTHITTIERNAFNYELDAIYFDGTMREWHNINGWESVPYETKVVARVEIQAYAFRNEEKIMVEAAVDGLESSQSLIMIGLDGNGNHVTYDGYYGEELYAGPLTIDGEETKKIEKVRIFVWESLESLRPMGAPLEINVIK